MHLSILIFELLQVRILHHYLDFSFPYNFKLYFINLKHFNSKISSALFINCHLMILLKSGDLTTFYVLFTSRRKKSSEIFFSLLVSFSHK